MLTKIMKVPMAALLLMAVSWRSAAYESLLNCLVCGAGMIAVMHYFRMDKAAGLQEVTA